MVKYCFSGNGFLYSMAIYVMPSVFLPIVLLCKGDFCHKPISSPTACKSSLLEPHFLLNCSLLIQLSPRWVSPFADFQLYFKNTNLIMFPWFLAIANHCFSLLWFQFLLKLLQSWCLWSLNICMCITWIKIADEDKLWDKWECREQYQKNKAARWAAPSVPLCFILMYEIIAWCLLG